MRDDNAFDWLTGRTARACLWIAGIGVFIYLVTSHGEHARSWLPFVILLACPLMHLLMHRHHGRKHHHGDRP